MNSLTPEQIKQIQEQMRQQQQQATAAATAEKISGDCILLYPQQPEDLFRLLLFGGDRELSAMYQCKVIGLRGLLIKETLANIRMTTCGRAFREQTRYPFCDLSECRFAKHVCPARKQNHY